MDRLFGETVNYRKCSEVDGYCEIMCKDNSKVFSAPIPYYIPCGTLGVYDYRMPFAETYYPDCEGTTPVKYRLDASMNFKLQGECENIPNKILDTIDVKIRENFKTDVSDKWYNICEDVNCSNLKNVEHSCDQNEKMDVVVKFSVLLSSMILDSSSGDSVDFENALKLIIRTENLIDLNTVNGATLNGETVVINMVLECPTGDRLYKTEDRTVCVPCSKGYYLNEGGECKPCDYGFYNDKLAQIKCEECLDMKVTYRRGVRKSDECKDKCKAGTYYDDEQDLCVPCKRHYYQHEEGKNFCLPCSKEYKTVAEGSDSENDCKDFCSIGKEYNKVNNEERCDECDEGYFKSEVGNAGRCEKCPDGFTTNGTRQGSCDLLNCVPGRYKLGDECMECEVGYYKSATGNDECQPCPDDSTTTNNVTGATDASQCDTEENTGPSNECHALTVGIVLEICIAALATYAIYLTIVLKRNRLICQKKDSSGETGNTVYANMVNTSSISRSTTRNMEAVTDESDFGNQYMELNRNLGDKESAYETLSSM